MWKNNEANRYAGPGKVQNILPKPLIQRDTSLNLETDHRDWILLSLQNGVPKAVNVEAGEIAFLSVRTIPKLAGKFIKQLAHIRFLCL